MVHFLKEGYRQFLYNLTYTSQKQIKKIKLHLIFEFKIRFVFENRNIFFCNLQQFELSKAFDNYLDIVSDVCYFDP